MPGPPHLPNGAAGDGLDIATHHADLATGVVGEQQLAGDGEQQLQRLERALRAAHALCDVLWEALGEELGEMPRPAGDGATPARVAALSKSLIDVTATVALLAQLGARAAPGVAPSSSAPAGEGRSPHTSSSPPSAPSSPPAPEGRSPGAPDPNRGDVSAVG